MTAATARGRRAGNAASAAPAALPAPGTPAAPAAPLTVPARALLLSGLFVWAILIVSAPARAAPDHARPENARPENARPDRHGPDHGATIGRSEPSAGDARRSGFADMRADSQAMQRDDGANPGMLGVMAGAALWAAPAGTANRSCADCHGEPARLRGVAARYPAVDSRTRSAISLEQRINACRIDHQRAAPLGRESGDLLSLTALVAHQSRGLPIAPPDDPRLADLRARGQARFEQRIGQLNFSCRDCHDTLAGRRLAGSTIPQGHPTGYPIYRLEWQGLGSLQRRLRNCMTGVRAEPFAYGAPEYLELEAYLQWRARGMVLETPAVRP